MKSKMFKVLVAGVAMVAIFVAQVSAASACFWSWHDPELPESLR